MSDPDKHRPGLGHPNLTAWEIADMIIANTLNPEQYIQPGAEGTFHLMLVAAAQTEQVQWIARAAQKPVPDLTGVIEAVRYAREAADGDSNDDEIAALQDALDMALEVLGLTIPE